MLAKDLKSNLNEDLIIKILEEMGCHEIRVRKGAKPHISAAMPDGDNPTSVCVYINGEDYNTEVFTRGDFQKRKNRDIIELVSFIKKISFPQAIKTICDICEFDYYSTPRKPQNSLLKMLSMWEGHNIKSGSDEHEDKPLPLKVFDQFYMCPIQKWIEEGIKWESQVEFNIGFDVDTKRIIVPIYNNINELVGIKGRLLRDEDIDGNNKYIFLYPCQKSRILFGLAKNYNDIVNKNTVIIVESEKSVIKLHGYGYKNVIAIGGKCASEHQIYDILRLGVDNVILCLDKDVSEEDIDTFAKQLNPALKLCNLYVMKDPLDLMVGEKESPCDNMDTWEVLYNNYLEEYDYERGENKNE